MARLNAEAQRTLREAGFSPVQGRRNGRPLVTVRGSFALIVFAQIVVAPTCWFLHDVLARFRGLSCNGTVSHV
ncbi:hypothetical protein BMF89_14710 [Arthrobacter sp. SRS-W-1-2016]|nr:hypothetical protein BMF89_14710 [Arthrobacter sp. SRS-W-1-2016]